MQVLTQAQFPLAGHNQSHHLVGDGQARQPARLIGQGITGAQQGLGAAGQPRKGEAQPCAGIGEQLGHQLAAQVSRVVDRRVERRDDLWLQACLFVKADLDVGQEHQLGLRLGIWLGQGLVIAVERVAQVALPARRIARSQAFQEGCQCSGTGGAVSERLQEACKFVADLGEDFLIAAGHGSAHPGEGGLWAKGGVQSGDGASQAAVVVAADSGAGACGHNQGLIHLGRALQQPFECTLQILLANALAGLLGGPRGEGASVGLVAGQRGHGLRQLEVGLRDLQIAHHWVGERGDALDLAWDRRCDAERGLGVGWKGRAHGE